MPDIHLYQDVVKLMQILQRHNMAYLEVGGSVPQLVGLLRMQQKAACDVCLRNRHVTICAKHTHIFGKSHCENCEVTNSTCLNT